MSSLMYFNPSKVLIQSLLSVFSLKNFDLQTPTGVSAPISCLWNSIFLVPHGVWASCTDCFFSKRGYWNLWRCNFCPKVRKSRKKWKWILCLPPNPRVNAFLVSRSLGKWCNLKSFKPAALGRTVCLGRWQVCIAVSGWGGSLSPGDCRKQKWLMNRCG